MVTSININIIFVMAKQTVVTKVIVKDVSRPGVHTKKSTSKLKPLKSTRRNTEVKVSKKL